MNMIDFPFGLKTRVERLLDVVIERQQVKLEMDKKMLASIEKMTEVSQNGTLMPRERDFGREQ
jgi:hypothetical protein